MAIKTYKAVSGQSTSDICLNTYGTLDRLYKLLQDSGVDNVNVKPYSGQIFTYDDSLVVDQNVYQATTLDGKRYATSAGNYGSTFYVVEQNPNSNTNPNKNPATPDNPVNPIEMYEAVRETTYTAAADGENMISVVDVNGNPLTNMRIVSVTKEILGILPADWFWNPVTSTLALVNGVTMDKDQTLFILYAETINT